MQFMAGVAPSYTIASQDETLQDDCTIMPMFRMEGLPRSGERALLTEIIIRAAIDIRRYPSASTEYNDAYAWVAAMSAEPHGFAWVCVGLGLDPQAAANRILAGAVVPVKRQRVRPVGALLRMRSRARDRMPGKSGRPTVHG